MQTALTSGEWYIDNNQSTEQLSLALPSRHGINNTNDTNNTNNTNSSSSSNSNSINSDHSGGSSNSVNASGKTGPKLVPVKSFQNDLLSVSVCRYCLSHPHCVHMLFFTLALVITILKIPFLNYLYVCVQVYAHIF